MTGNATKVCRGPNCDAVIRLARTVDGAWMPVDPDPVPDGELVWTNVGDPGAPDWRMRVLTTGETVADGTRRFRPHWATCPDAEGMRMRQAVARVREVFPDAQVVETPAADPAAAPASQPATDADPDGQGALFPDTRPADRCRTRL